MVNTLNRKKEFTLDINGIKMSGVAYGDSRWPPMLALHGWLDNAASFSLLAEQLPERYLIALDFMGHGKSAHRSTTTPYYIWDNVTEVYLAMQALNLPSADVIGHSMGASIAMLFAGCFPANVKNLYLIEGIAPLHYDTEQLPALMATAIRKRGRIAAKTSKRYPSVHALVQARMNARFPVSRQAAQLLVERGSLSQQHEFIWSSDPALLLPSINRMCTEQILSFLRAVEAKVTLFLAEDGLHSEQWQLYITQLKNLQTKTFAGNHHLHMQNRGALAISAAIKATAEV
ncbi:MAG: alpha/beta fold hydrolase [Oceanospirillaceae bacterium]|nr:alpha/beta fold hydrolase [Oceanospirillaceae bacterium]